MSEEKDKEIAKLKGQLESKHAAMNEFLSQLQDKDYEIKRLVKERRDQDEKIEELEKKLKKARVSEIDARRREELAQRFLDLAIPVMKEAYEKLEAVDAGRKVRERIRVLFFPHILPHRALDIAVKLRKFAQTDQFAASILEEVGLDEFYEIATELSKEDR